MARVIIKIYDEESDDILVQEDSTLFDNEDEIALQAYRVQKAYFDLLEKEEALMSYEGED